MGSILNSATAPFGVKLFKGGPYPDKGLGDVQQGMIRDTNANWDQLYGYGNRMLSGTDRTPGSDPFTRMNTALGEYRTAASGGLQPLEGYAAHLIPALQMYAKAYGLPDPMSAGAGANFDPYSLAPHQQTELGQGLDQITGQRRTAESLVRQQLASRGITSGPILDAALRRMHDHYDTEQSKHRTGYMSEVVHDRQQGAQGVMGGVGDLANAQEGQFSRRMGNLAQLLDQYRATIGQGSAMMGQATSGKMGNAQQVGNLAQQTAANTQNAWSNITGMAGMLMGRLAPTGAKPGAALPSPATYKGDINTGGQRYPWDEKMAWA